jgi:hypothetical protein
LRLGCILSPLCGLRRIRLRLDTNKNAALSGGGFILSIAYRP